MRVTIADIAAQLGLSKSTVSIGLRNDPRLPIATRTLIQERAKQLGYRPDPNLAIIAAQRWRRSDRDHGIGVALLDNRREPARETRQKYLHHAQRRLEALGYHPTVFNLDDQPSVAATHRILVARGIRGLLIPPIYDDQLLDQIDLGRFALSAAGVARWRPPFAVASLDVFESVALSLQKMVDAGYRRVGVATLRHPGNMPDDARREGAIARAQLIYGASGVKITAWMGTTDSFAPNRKDLVAWFRATQPDAILCLNEFAIDWLQSAKEPISPEMGYVVLNRVNPKSIYAGIDPQHQRIGEAAAELLDQEIRHNRAGPPSETPLTVTVPPQWVEGTSLPQRHRPPPPAAAKRLKR